MLYSRFHLHLCRRLNSRRSPSPAPHRGRRRSLTRRVGAGGASVRCRTGRAARQAPRDRPSARCRSTAVGVDRAGTGAPDALGTFLGQRLGEADHASLCGGIVDLADLGRGLQAHSLVRDVPFEPFEHADACVLLEPGDGGVDPARATSYECDIRHDRSGPFLLQMRYEVSPAAPPPDSRMHICQFLHCLLAIPDQVKTGLAPIKWRGIGATDRLFFELGGAGTVGHGMAPNGVMEAIDFGAGEEGFDHRLVVAIALAA